MEDFNLLRLRIQNEYNRVVKIIKAGTIEGGVVLDVDETDELKAVLIQLQEPIQKLLLIGDEEENDISDLINLEEVSE